MDETRANEGRGRRWVRVGMVASAATLALVVGGALVDLAPLHDGREAGRAIFVAAITGSGVDRPALEALRAEKLADMTVASEQILTSLADIADVLTPEQRVELAEMAERWHH